MFFEIYLLCSTNRKFQKKLLIDCDCYKMYNTEEAFIENVIINRKSYMACLGYRSNTRNRSGHRSVPIFLGSYLDYRIRGKEAVEKSRGQWGLVILRGVLKMYSSFSTFGKYIAIDQLTVTCYNYPSTLRIFFNYRCSIATCS